MIAAVDKMLEHLNSKNIAEIGAFESEFLGRVELPVERIQCAAVVGEAIRGALADRRQRLLVEFNGEDALICTCFGVGELRVRETIIRDSLETVDEVAAATNAGSGCGSCRMIIQEMLDSR